MINSTKISVQKRADYVFKHGVISYSFINKLFTKDQLHLQPGKCPHPGNSF